MKENAIEWLSREESVTATLSYGHFANKVKKLAEQYPDDVKILGMNDDGTIVAHFPLRYLHISHPRIVHLTDEEREKRRERLVNWRKKRQ